MFGLGSGRRIRRTRKGDFELRLPAAERQLLTSLLPQLRQLIQVDQDPALRRLYPTAYVDDVERDREYQALVHEDLQSRQLAAVADMEATLGADRVDEEQLLAWLGALNALRLVLGTKLDVSEDTDLGDLSRLDPDDPDSALLVPYFYLTMLQDQVVEALQA